MRIKIGPLECKSTFLVVDRGGLGENCEEMAVNPVIVTVESDFTHAVCTQRHPIIHWLLRWRSYWAPWARIEISIALTHPAATHFD